MKPKKTEETELLFDEMYANEIKALKRAGRFRVRKLYDTSYKDFASNDYLGLAHHKELHRDTCNYLERFTQHAPKASMLVNGYHRVHQEFEKHLCDVNGFEAGVVLGSGFNANIALIEALVRRGDTLFMDEMYHASGVLASEIGEIDTCIFPHNNMQKLEEYLKRSTAKRKIIAVEGIYSMDGDLCPKEVFTLAEKYQALLIVDEAHSSGVVGKNLMGVYDLYDIQIRPNHIKMGTLGKAYGSFGAYILSSSHINEYLVNRAKPIIYATALSLYDTALAHLALEYIVEHKVQLHNEIEKRKEVVKDILGIAVDGLIVPIHVGDNKKVLTIQKKLQDQGYMIGAIRQPTVASAILRIIIRLGESVEDLVDLCHIIKSELS